jgi:hypothetical protein
LIEDDVVNSEEDSNENVGMVNGEPNSVSSNASIKYLLVMSGSP